MNEFADLIPAGKQQQAGGEFSDLIPKQQAAAPKPQAKAQELPDFPSEFTAADVGMPMLAAMPAYALSRIAGLGAMGGSMLGLTGAPEPRLGATPQGFADYVQQRLMAPFQPKTQTGKDVMGAMGKVGDVVGAALDIPVD